MKCHPVRTFALVLGAAVALLSDAALAITFSVSQAITVSGVTSGSGTGSGTATLDPATGTHVIVNEARHASGKLTYDIARIAK